MLIPTGTNLPTDPFASSGPIIGTDAVIPVSALNRAIGSMLERSFPLVWVSGEVSNITRAASGHWYFSIKDAKAQMRCVMFRGRAQYAERRRHRRPDRGARPGHDVRTARRVATWRGGGASDGTRPAVRGFPAPQGATRSQYSLPPRGSAHAASSAGDRYRDVVAGGCIARRLDDAGPPRAPCARTFIRTRAGGRWSRSLLAMVEQASARREVDVLIVSRGRVDQDGGPLTRKCSRHCRKRGARGER